MARKKPTSLIPISDLTEANIALAEVADLQRQIRRVEDSHNDEVDRMKAEKKAQVAPIEAELKVLETRLAAYAEYNKAVLFADKRSKELPFGFIGFRKSTEIKPKPKSTFAIILGRVIELGIDSAVRIKKELNKEEMRTWSDAKLESVGARRVIKDEFWFEVKEDTLTDEV